MFLKSPYLIQIFVICKLCLFVRGNTFTRGKRSVSCGGVIQVVDHGELFSPNYPKNYPSEAKCNWQLIGPENKQLKITITDLEIEQSEDCSYDYLEIYGLDASLSVGNFTRFCGTYKDKSWITRNNRATLNFVSDVNYEERGFHIHYSIQSTDKGQDCNRTLNGSTGTVSSPGYPSNYPNSANCWAVIQVPDGLQISLKIDTLMVEHSEGADCKYDHLRVYNGNENSDLLAELCKEAPSAPIISTGNRLTLHFMSDDFLNSKGYAGVFRAVKGQSQVRTPEAGDCVWDIKSNGGEIASPNYPKKYPGNAKCVIKLISPPNSYIQFKFQAISLEHMSGNIVYDFVRIYDGKYANSTVIGTYAGTDVLKAVIKSSGPMMTVEFGSDAFMEFSGFKGVYEFIKTEGGGSKLTTTTEKSPTDGSGDVNELLREKPSDVAVTIGERYIMKCTPRLKNTTITWIKGQKIIGVELIPGLRILEDNSLSINKMTNELEGTYTCVAHATNGNTASVTALVFSKQPDTIVEDCKIKFVNKPENKTLLVGEFTFLGCYMDGATISWKHNGQLLTSNNRITVLYNGYLSINNIEESDNGIYTCTARHTGSGCVLHASSYVQIVKPANLNTVCGKPQMNNPATDKPRLEHGKIVNGFAAKKGAYPWMVMLYTPTLGVYCGGSLINEQWILTAAHCFIRQSIALSTVQIKLGKNDKSIHEEGEKVFQVADLIIHDKFDATTYDNDIALIKLKGHVTFTNSILPICLATDSFQRNKFFSRGPQMGTATGWGSKWHRGPKSRVLLEVVLPIVNLAICKSSTTYTVTSNMFCAGYALAGAGDTCSGDSGGPFGMKNGNQWYLVGITSWGEKCSLADKYGYYTRVSNYITWIHNVIKT